MIEALVLFLQVVGTLFLSFVLFVYLGWIWSKALARAQIRRKVREGLTV